MSQPFFPGQPDQPPAQPYPPAPQAPFGPQGYPPNPAAYPPAAYPPAVYPPAAYPQPSPTNGFAIAALITGIVALPLAFVPLVNGLAIIAGIAAVVLGLIGAHKQTAKGVSIAGTVLGGVALVISIIVIIVSTALLHSVTTEVIVDYTATVSTGSANASYGTISTSNQDFTGSWSDSESVPKVDGSVSLYVYGNDFTQDQTVTCEIRVNGAIVSSESGTYMASCYASLY